MHQHQSKTAAFAFHSAGAITPEEELSWDVDDDPKTDDGGVDANDAKGPAPAAGPATASASPIALPAAADASLEEGIGEKPGSTSGETGDEASAEGPEGAGRSGVGGREQIKGMSRPGVGEGAGAGARAGNRVGGGQVEAALGSREEEGGPAVEDSREVEEGCGGRLSHEGSRASSSSTSEWQVVGREDEASGSASMLVPDDDEEQVAGLPRPSDR